MALKIPFNKPFIAGTPSRPESREYAPGASPNREGPAVLLGIHDRKTLAERLGKVQVGACGTPIQQERSPRLVI